MIQLLFGKLFQDLRKKEGMKYTDISEKTGLDRMTLWRLSKAKTQDDFNATLKLVNQVCMTLGVGLNEIIRFKRK